MSPDNGPIELQLVDTDRPCSSPNSPESHVTKTTNYHNNDPNSNSSSSSSGIQSDEQASDTMNEQHLSALISPPEKHSQPANQVQTVNTEIQATSSSSSSSF